MNPLSVPRHHALDVSQGSSPGETPSPSRCTHHLPKCWRSNSLTTDTGAEPPKIDPMPALPSRWLLPRSNSSLHRDHDGSPLGDFATASAEPISSSRTANRQDLRELVANCLRPLLGLEATERRPIPIRASSRIRMTCRPLATNRPHCERRRPGRRDTRPETTHLS